MRRAEESRPQFTIAEAKSGGGDRVFTIDDLGGERQWSVCNSKAPVESDLARCVVEGGGVVRWKRQGLEW